MNKRITRVIGLILTVALLLNVIYYPTTTAFASNGIVDKQIVISYEGNISDIITSEPTEQPEPSEQPTETQEPSPTQPTEPSLQPTPIPSESEKPIETPLPKPTELPEPGEEPLPTPTETNPAEEFIEFAVPLGLEELLDENGYLTDEGLLSLKPLPFEHEKYTEITDLGGGKHTMKLYTEPIKFENDKGEYELIDNSIVPVDLAEDTNHEFKNEASDVEVLMSDSLEESSAIQVNYQDYSIGFSPLNILKKDKQHSEDINFIVAEESKNEKVKDYKKEEKTNKDKRSEGKTDKIREDVFDETKEYKSIEYTQTFNESTDIQITPTRTGVKEDIILYEIPEETEFSYEFTVGNVVPLLRMDGNLYFVDVENGYLVAAIAAPYMYDSKEEFSESNDIEVKLIQTGENKYKYTLIPNREFIEDENNVYPIIIDPAVQTTGGMILDTYTTSRYSGNNYVNDDNLKVGYSSDLYKSRGLVKINQFPVGSGNTITNAVYWAYQNYSGSSTPTIQVARIMSDWNPYNVNWSNQPADYYVENQQTVQAETWYGWGLTSLVRAWHDGSAANYGMYVKSSDEGSNKYKRFYSANSSTCPNYFYIEYEDYAAPNTPTNFTCTPSFSSPTGSVTLNWNPPSDNGYSGVNHYQVVKWVNGSWGDYRDVYGTTFTYTCQDNTLYHFGVRAFDNKGNYADNWAFYYNLMTPDKTGPKVPADVKGTPIFSGQTGTINFTWSAVSDVGNSGLKHYEARKRITGGSWEYKTVSSTTTSCTFSSCIDNSSYECQVRAVDNSGNASAWGIAPTINTPDKTGPIKPPSFSISPATGTSNTTPTIKWSGVTDPGGHLVKMQYELNSSGIWNDIGTNYGVASGSFPITASLKEGQNSIKVRGMDKDNNEGIPSNPVNYTKDTTPPKIDLFKVSTQNPNGIVYVDAIITDSGSSIEWKLDYGSGYPAVSYCTPELNKGTTVVNGRIFEWDTTKDPNIQENKKYTLRLRAKDALGNESTEIIELLKAYGSVFVASKLQIDQPVGYDSDGYKPDVEDIDRYVIDSPITNVLYQKINSGGIAGLSPGKLYVNNKLHDTETTAGQGFEFNAAAYDDENEKWLYPEGSIVFMYAQVRDSTGGELYSTGTQEALQIADVFSDMTKIDPDPLKIDHVELVNNDYIQLMQSYSSGSFESIKKQFAGDISYVDLTVDQTLPTGSSISYQVSVDGGQTWQPITPISTNGGVPVNHANRKYFGVNVGDGSIGDSVKIRATLNKGTASESPKLDSWSIDVRYTTYATALLVDNEFPKNARGITNLNLTYHDEESKSIKLAKDAPEGSIGTVESTVRITSNDAIRACLEVEENVPDGTSIEYFISTQGGGENGNWFAITPKDASIAENWGDIPPGTEVAIKAVLTGSGTNSPKLKSWKLGVEEKLGGSPYMVKLVDEPWNLSTLTDVTHRTLLRWEASDTDDAEDPDDVRYNVYRSTTPHFVPSDDFIVAEGITENSWYDPYIDFKESPYEKTFYYKVTATKVFPESGTDKLRESLPSNEAEATVVSEKEIEKKLGLQNYWGYTGFNTGSGTGYINVSNGNLSYITTDIVVSDPFFAMVMRRTYNSLAETKTAMGYGWDFSFNTCLLREYNSDGTDKAMILKDGDGSFHYFEYKDGKFQPAKGTFMKLQEGSEQNEETGENEPEYQITRKDNIVYHFDADSLKLKSFSDNNGNKLIFTYDKRGNLETVENTVGEKIELKYKVVGKEPGDRDYIPEDADYTYVNWHPDLLDSVTWTEGGVTDPVSITYYYDYNVDNDKLECAYTEIERSTIYEEKFTYNENKQLITISDPKDTETDISYDGAGRVSRVTDAISDYYDFSYVETDNKPTQTIVKNKNNVGISYIYDGDGLVTEKTDALGHSIGYTYGADPLKDQFLVTRMSYDNKVNGGATQTISYNYTYELGNIKTITAPDGTVTRYGAYTSYNKPLSVSIENGSDRAVTNYEYENGNLKKTTDPEGKVTTNTYDPVNDHIGYLTQVEGVFGNQTRYSYDTKGRVVAVNEYNNGTPVRTAATYEYDYNPNYDNDDYFMSVKATDAMGNSVTSYYDMLGRIVEKEYPDNTDNEDNPNVYEEWQYDLVGNVTWMRDTSGSEVYYHYDDLYRLEQTDYEDGSHNSVDYSGKWDSDTRISGNDADYVVKTDGTGVQTIEYYDMAGRLVKTSIKSGTDEVVTARYEYDNIGNCIKVTDNAGRVSEAQYNKIGQQTKTIIDPTGMNIETIYGYDFLGNQSSVTDGENNTTSYAYDKDGRLKNVSQTVAGNALTTSYEYDQRVGGYIKNIVTDAKGQISETWFDPMGRKIKDYNVGLTNDDETAMETSYTYNKNYQVDIVTRNDKTKEKYDYNAFGQVKRIDYYEATESTSDKSDDCIEYKYDNSGKVTEEKVSHGGVADVTVYVYDQMSRLRQMRQGTDDGTLTINYLYDKAGRVRYISYAKGDGTRALVYDYDNLGRIICIKLALGVMPNSADDVLSSAKKVRGYVYKTNGELDHTKDFRTLSADEEAYIKTAYTINGAGLTTGITYTDYSSPDDTTGTVKEQYTMGYDDRGFITSETATTNYGSSQTVNKSYLYDSIGRLTTATIGDKTNTYTYDNVGNRATMYDGTGTFAYSYNEFNQLKTVTKNGSAYSSYEYDGRGNQDKEVQKYLEVTVDGTTTSYDKTTTYGYDLSNQLVSVNSLIPEANETTGEVTNKSELTTNAYNASGQRIKRVEGGETTEYYYSGSSILYTTDALSHLLTENILDLSGSIIASARFEDETPDIPDDYFFYHYDMRGSTTAIIQPNGSLITGYSYDEFGKLEQKGATGFLNDVTFTGSVSDTSSGLQYMNARYYQPSTGRFLTQDSYTGNPYDPWTQHLYSYCGNNPTNMIDPTGHLGVYHQEMQRHWQKKLGLKNGQKYKPKSKEDQVREALAKALNPTSIALEHMMEYNGHNWEEIEKNPSASNIIKYATMGAIDIDRMINNDKPLSLDHWMANINAGLFAYGLYSAGTSAVATNAATKEMIVPKGSLIGDSLFKAPSVFTNSEGFITNGTYKIGAESMSIHKTGSLAGGKSQFLSSIDAETAVLDACAYADDFALWTAGNQAKVPTNMSIGVVGKTGELTNWIEVTRTRTGLVHGWPCKP